MDYGQTGGDAYLSIARASRIKNEMCYIQLCIDSYDDGEIRGRLFNAYYREALFFDSSMSMIRQMDEIFDTFGYPHATMDLRRFDTSAEAPVNKGQRNLQPAPEYLSAAAQEGAGRSLSAAAQEGTAQRYTRSINQAPTQKLYTHTVRGKLATLRMRVMFRQNASWQGSVKWVEEDLEENFSSVLELLLLIDSVFDDPSPSLDAHGA